MYKNRIRPQEPALFNPNRLYELPIPLIEPAAENMEPFLFEELTDGNPALENEQANEVNEVLENQNLLIINVQENVIDGAAQGENLGSREDEIDVKQEPELIIMNETDAAEFERILQCGDEDLDISNNLLNLSVEDEPSPTESELNDSEEIEFEQVDSFPKPMVCTEDVLSKFEDDPISFDLSYASKVRLN